MECRTCLGQFNDSDVIDVETKIIDQKNVLQAIEEVASIEVPENDTLPKQICQDCLRSLESAVTFRKQVISSHFELKKRQSDLCDPLFINNDERHTRSIVNLRLTSKIDRGKHTQQNELSDNEDEKLSVKEERKFSEKLLREKEETVESKQNYEEIDDEDDDKGPHTPDIPEFEDSGSDWNDENQSSDDIFDEKPIKKGFSKTASKKSLTQPRKTRRKRTVLKKLLKEISDTSSSEDNDSDVPLEELRKEIKDLDKKTEPKIRKKREKKDNAEGPRLCPICGKLFKARQNFNSHMTTVHRKKPEKPDKISCLCPDCGRVITGTRQNFVAHRRYHHSDKAQVKKRFTCDVCPRKFYREKNLIIHQRIHKGEKGYVCELCPDKSYTQIGGLILHRRKVHLKKPTCTCNYCGKQFYEKHYLETHIRQWHTGERPFSCEICGKAFSCNGTLLRHRKDSHGEKKPCPKCGKMYTEGELRKHLKRHKIREEGIKRKKYTCEYCGTEMNFTSRKRHLLKQHGIMLRGRGENAERVPITRADAM